MVSKSQWENICQYGTRCLKLVLMRANPVYPCTHYAKQIRMVNKAAGGRVTSAQENRLFEGLGCFLLIID